MSRMCTFITSLTGMYTTAHTKQDIAKYRTGQLNILN